MSDLERALDEFGAVWQENGWFFRDPHGVDAYITVLDEIEYRTTDTPGLIWAVHSTVLELYDDGGKAAERARRRLSRILASHNLAHTRRPAVYLENIKKAMTAYDLKEWFEKGSIYANEGNDPQE